MKTWHIEMLVAAAVLSAVAVWRGHWIDWIGAAAVLASFGHMQVAERMRERQAVAAVGPGSAYAVECHRWLTAYLVGKEVLWVVFFVVTESYPALVGCALFLLYPVWRARRRARR